MDHVTGELIGPTNPPVMEGPEVTGGLRAPKSNRGVTFYRIYWKDSRRQMFTLEELASIVKALSDDLLFFNPYKQDALIFVLKGPVEVEIGLQPCYIQVSSPDPSKPELVWQRVSNVINQAEEGGD